MAEQVERQKRQAETKRQAGRQAGRNAVAGRNAERQRRAGRDPTKRQNGDPERGPGMAQTVAGGGSRNGRQAAGTQRWQSKAGRNGTAENGRQVE